MGVMGTWRGDELALLVGAYHREVNAVVSFSCSGMAFPTPHPTGPRQPAWTWKGRAVPTSWTGADPEGAQIPVERTAGPVLLFAGRDDPIWDASAPSKVAMGRLKRRRPYRDQYITYSGTGHAFQPPHALTSGSASSFGG